MTALSGVRVLDLTHMLSGPYAAMLLADLGAETIKVEPPGSGEGTRRLLADDPNNSREGMGAYFLTLNRNKQSITLDLKSPDGIKLFYELVRVSDVVLYNFSTGVAERLGIAHRNLSEINPRIITASVTGFGETGPHRAFTSFDMVAQGTGGGMSITGMPGGMPLRSGIPIGDLGGGMMAAIGVLAALQARSTTGRGQHVDISMQDAQVSLLNYMATMYFLSGHVPGPMANDHFVHVPYGTFQASDGWLIIAVITDDFWVNLVHAIGLPALDTEAHRKQPGRLANRVAIEAALAERFATDTQAAWLEKLRAARVPSAPVNDLAQALNDPHVIAREMVVEVPLPSGGTVRQPGNPVKLSGTPGRTFTAPPRLGEHTEAVLTRLLGKSRDELTALRTRGVL
jgi:crotonobetainyl-CoA:carnitine CoA-transferase CaiB-like acyl-CoA transferase